MAISSLPVLSKQQLNENFPVISMINTGLEIIREVRAGNMIFKMIINSRQNDTYTKRELWKRIEKQNVDLSLTKRQRPQKTVREGSEAWNEMRENMDTEPKGGEFQREVIVNSIKCFREVELI